MQESTVKNFYSQNKYIEYTMLSKLQVSKPKDFIEQVIGKDKGKFLTNFYVSNDFIALAEAQVQDIVQNTGSYLDLASFIPSPFRDQDITDLVKLIGENCRLLANHQHLCSEKFILRCLDQFRLFSEELALKRLRSGMKPQTEETRQKPKLEKSISSKSQGKGGKKRGKGRDQEDDQDDEETKDVDD